MGKQQRLFDLPARKRRVLMHVVDAGGCDHGQIGEINVLFQCLRCGLKSEWLIYPNVTAAKRGRPCPRCNEGESANG